MKELLNTKIEIEKAAKTAFIDSSIKSNSDYRASFLTNNQIRGSKFINNIKKELLSCNSFDFSIAFITKSGITPLLQVFKTLEENNIKGRILTTDYLAFSEPEALIKLNNFKNISVRMFSSKEDSGFHTKGYLFTYRNYQKVFVGSSNMTANALAVNNEWNISFTSLNDGQLIKEVRQEFEDLWNKSENLNRVIKAYSDYYLNKKKLFQDQKVVPISSLKLKPNSMQLEFISSLDKVIQNNERKALLISSTGTGKTYASAFAMQKLKPHKILFLAHREQILKQSKNSYKKIFGSSKKYGILSGNSHPEVGEVDILFSTMQTMQKDHVLKTFAQDDFDCVIIDEVHRAGSQGYQKIMEYFNPSLYLGMTATPERMDDFDLYGLFDNNIVYEIRLQQALEYDLLCPFHYFGITDIVVDGKEIEDKSNFNNLISNDRVKYIIEKANFYGWSGDRVKGLVFVSTKKEGMALSEKFNEEGYKTIFLSGEDSQEKRLKAIEMLVANENDINYEDRLDYIFTVDIFNEGVDIPEVNQVLLLRPTQSPIIFVQQLGRGLRKFENKEYLVVVDFIGNYTNNYMIPIALSGDRSYNKDSIRKYVMESDSVIPGKSSVSFDEISKEKIFKSIDSSSLGIRFLRTQYSNLKNKLGRIPFMVDYLKYGEVDPLLFVEKFKSYYRFLSDNEPKFKNIFNREEILILDFISKNLANGMRPHELLMLRELIDNGTFDKNSIKSSLTKYELFSLNEETYKSSLNMLNKGFVGTETEQKTYDDVYLIEIDDGNNSVNIISELKDMLDNQSFKSALEDIIDYGLSVYTEKYYEINDEFKLYEKYSRRDVCRLLNCKKDTSSTLYGYRVFDDPNVCPIFVTYNKSDDISKSTDYADEFLSKDTFSWMSRSKRTLESDEIKKIVQSNENGLDLRLFIKKSDDEGSDYYYFGKVRKISEKQTVQLIENGEKLPIVNFIFKLDKSVQDDMYDYFDGPRMIYSKAV